MNPIKRSSQLKLIPILLTLLAVCLPVNSTLAHEILAEQQNKEVGQGMFLGVNAGPGGGIFQYKTGTTTITEEPKHGGLGGLRLGYAFSPKFALSLQGFSFLSQKEDQDWCLRTAVVAATFHPCGSGFFLRTGIGGGWGKFHQPITGNQITVDGRVAFLFSIGYDWWLNDHLTLGLSMDSIGLDVGGASGFEDDRMGSGSLTVQFNWYL